MSASAVRIVIGMALFPLTLGVLWTVGPLVALHLNDWGYTIAVTFDALLIVGLWWFLWRRAATATARRRAATLSLAAITIGGSLIGSLPDAAFQSIKWTAPDWNSRFGVICGLWALWIGGTAWLWRDPRPRLLLEPFEGIKAAAFSGDGQPIHPSELARCPQCDYALTGLREVRCPECGWASTVDDVVDRTFARVVGEE